MCAAMPKALFVAYYPVSTDKQCRAGPALLAQQRIVDDYLKDCRGKLVGSFVERERGKDYAKRPVLGEVMRVCRTYGAALLIAQFDRFSRDADWLLGLEEQGHTFVCASNPNISRLELGIIALEAAEALRMLDRLSRSLKDLLFLMERIDTTTAGGRMMMQMIGAFAEFERAMIRERTQAGLATARAEGRIGGRRRKLDAGKRKEIAESIISGRESGAEMARLYDVSQATASRIVAEYRIASTDGRARVRKPA
jgi:DNA invertase Pin-like site-specific DNA recombinase